MSNFSLITLAIILSSLSIILGLYLLWNLRTVNQLRKTFIVGKSNISLESILNSLGSTLKDLNHQQQVTETHLTQLQHDFGFSIQKIGVVRFNPFEDGGGNFSFSLALLNGHNSGVVITSMHGRQQNRIYTKRVEGGKCDSPLTGEEQQAIDSANSKYHPLQAEQTNSKISKNKSNS